MPITRSIDNEAIRATYNEMVATGKSSHRWSVAIFTITVASLAISVYSVFIKEAPSIPERTLQCLDLFDRKVEQYFGDQYGNRHAIWSADRKTCLAMQLYNDPYGKKFYAMVLDMANDETLLYYSVDEGEMTDENASLNGETREMTWDEMTEEVKNFGFSI